MSKYQEYADKPRDFLALTGYTREEFDALLPHFEHHFYEWMKTHRLDEHPRGNRKYSDYRNSPLPTIADKLFFIRHYIDLCDRAINRPQIPQITLIFADFRGCGAVLGSQKHQNQRKSVKSGKSACY